MNVIAHFLILSSICDIYLGGKTENLGTNTLKMRFVKMW